MRANNLKRYTNYKHCQMKMTTDTRVNQMNNEISETEVYIIARDTFVVLLCMCLFSSMLHFIYLYPIAIV